METMKREKEKPKESKKNNSDKIIGRIIGIAIAFGVGYNLFTYGDGREVLLIFLKENGRNLLIGLFIFVMILIAGILGYLGNKILEKVAFKNYK